MWRTLLATATILGAGTSAFLAETEGLAAFTSEAGRRLAVARSPIPLPPVALRDGWGVRLQLPATGRPLLVELVYTNCPSLCASLGASFARIQEGLERVGAASAMQLLSVSFDPARDGPAELRAYALAHGADPVRWRVAAPVSEPELRALLDALQVVVIPDGEGGFVHNAALHLIDRQGRLAAILDPEEVDRAVAELAR